jgi:acyl-CoA synthetase (AMP-forming)/AMP-acid ligase II
MQVITDRSQFIDVPLPRVLQTIASDSPEDRGYTFVGEDGVSEVYFSFRSMAQHVARYAAALQRLGLRRGERVAMVIPDGQQFVFTFLGAMHAGLVPVPMSPPATLGNLTNYLEVSRHLVIRSEAAALICTAEVRRILGSLAGGSLRRIVAVEDLPLDSTEAPLADLSASDMGFIQFTSGSTSRPKGVVLTHGNLSANAHCIMNLGLKATPEDRGCTWLPFYHDMGLIGFVLAPLVTRTPVAFMQPLAFLKRPSAWLHMVTRHRGSIGFGPNFAYGLCTSRIKDHELKGVDLSSWRIAGCGAEPIQLATLDAFADRFSSVGFRPEAFMPCFGMAESTLAVTFHDLDERARAERLRMDRLSRDNVAELAEAIGDFETSQFVSCGKPFEGHAVAIRAEDGTFLPERQVGEIVIQGPSVMHGYYKDPDATAETIRDGWLHTGDKGYLSDGELYVCGRIKDMIIVAGKNYYPTDIEWAAGEVEGVRRGNVVAFGVGEFGQAERVILAAEYRTRPSDPDTIIRNVKARVLEQIGVRVDEVLLLESGSIPKTTSGKLQRRKSKEMYMDGSLMGGAKIEGSLDLARHLVTSQWGLLKNRVRTTFSGTTDAGE